MGTDSTPLRRCAAPRERGAGMSGYLLRRIAISVIVLLGISVVIFTLQHVIYPAPGRDVLGVTASVAAVKSWNRQHGFDGPVAVQYWRYMSPLFHGNLGYSVTQNQPVAALFAHRWARSAYLSGTSLLLGILISIPIGIFQAVRRNNVADHVASGLQLALYATPPFLFYLLAIQLLAFSVPVLSYQASQSSSLLTVMADWHDMALPIGCLAVLAAAAFSRYLRSAAIDALAHDYIKVLRAKGLSERLVLSRHLLRNACLPMITLLGLSVPALLTGNFFAEAVFNYNGLGLMYYTAVRTTDYPVMLAYTLFAAARLAPRISSRRDEHLPESNSPSSSPHR